MAAKIRFTNKSENGRLVGDAFINLPITVKEANELAEQIFNLIRSYTKQ